MPASRSGECRAKLGKLAGLISWAFGIKKGPMIQSRGLMMVALWCLTSCATTVHRSSSGNAEGAQVSQNTNASKPHAAPFWAPWRIFSSKKTPPPPKAFALQEVGTIQSVSADGSYVIVQLAPGTLVHTGDTLIITSKDHAPSRLKAAEVQPPCFAAEVEEGSVATGEIVKR